VTYSYALEEDELLCRHPLCITTKNVALGTKTARSALQQVTRAMKLNIPHYSIARYLAKMEAQLEGWRMTDMIFRSQVFV
jgi:hypothetical protein